MNGERDCMDPRPCPSFRHLPPPLSQLLEAVEDLPSAESFVRGSVLLVVGGVWEKCGC